MCASGSSGDNHRRRLRFGCLMYSGYLPVREMVADPGVEINAFGKGAAERLRDSMRYVRINVAAAGRELDPQVAGSFVINEAANNGRRHALATLQPASGAVTDERLRLNAANIPPSASAAPAIVVAVQR